MVSLIITTFNEGSNIGALLADVIGQTRRPDEVVLVDGGSTDNTVSVCEESRSKLEGAGIRLNLQIVRGANIPRGRNVAIGAAANEILCVTDAGCRLDPAWCERITRPIVENRADFVGGFFRPSYHNKFQRILAALTVADRPPRGFLPSSRSIAFTKAAWERAGHYPEWLPWGEDTLFNEMCLASGARFCVAEDAIVHWEVRPTFRAAIRQFYRYARGDGMRRRVSASHMLNVGAVVLPLALAVAVNIWWIALFPAYTMLIVGKAGSKIRIPDLPMALSLVFAIRVARAAGYLLGVASSLRSPAEKRRT